MVKGSTLIKLLEHCNKEVDGAILHESADGELILRKGGKVVKSYAQVLREHLGIKTDILGNTYVDKKSRSLEARHVSFQEVAHTFLGRHFDNYLDRARYMWMMEGEGGQAVNSSALSNINAFTVTVSGLAEALIGEAFVEGNYIGDQVTTEVSTDGGGGYVIRGVAEGGVALPLNEMEAAPTNVIKGTKTLRLPAYSYRECVMVTKEAFRLDLTGKLQDDAQAVGIKIRRAKENDIARVVLGVDNPFVRDGKTANTYQTTAEAASADAPNKWVNQIVNPLETYLDLDEAVEALMDFRDPFTGFDVMMPDPVQLIVHTGRLMQTNKILKDTTIESSPDSTRTIVSIGNNPSRNMSTLASRQWQDVATAAGQTTPTTAFYMGDFKKAFSYELADPFGIVDDPAEISQRRNIIMCKVAKLAGRAQAIAPWYVLKGTPS